MSVDGKEIQKKEKNVTSKQWNSNFITFVSHSHVSILLERI